MKAKTLTFLFASVLALVLFTSFASAAFDVSATSLTFTETGSKTLTVTNTGDSAIDLQISSVISPAGFAFAVTPKEITGLEPGNSTSIAIDLTAENFDSLDFLDRDTATFTITESAETAETITLNLENTEFCDRETSTNLQIDVRSIETLRGFGDDDNFWYPGDEVEIEVDIEYNGDNSRDEFIDGVLDWALYTRDGEEVLSGDEDISDLDDGDDERITFSFTVDPSDLDADTEDYILYLSITGEEDYDDSDKEDKDICRSTSEQIEIRQDRDLVVLSDFEYPETVQCGSELRLTADVWNIGDRDQDDVSVRYQLSDGTTLAQDVIEVGNIDSFDNDNLEILISIPEDADEAFYHLRLWVLDEDGDVYETDEDNDEIYYDLPVQVSGSCEFIPNVLVTASLESEVRAGRDLIIKATITNSGDSLEMFSISATGYSAWASEAEIEPATVTLSAGESRDVTLTFAVNRDAEGDKSFTIGVSSGDELVAQQPVSVTIEKSGFDLGIINADNWYLWLIGALNIILVIIIIIVAIRVARG